MKMPSKKKKYNARFPAGRIKKIMQSDEEIGKVAQAVPVIISRTLELFVESLLTKTVKITNSRNAKTLSPSHMKQCIMAENRFDFLRELVKNVPDICVAEDVSNDSSPEATIDPSDTPYDLSMPSTSNSNETITQKAMPSNGSISLLRNNGVTRSCGTTIVAISQQSAKLNAGPSEESRKAFKRQWEVTNRSQKPIQTPSLRSIPNRSNSIVECVPPKLSRSESAPAGSKISELQLSLSALSTASQQHHKQQLPHQQQSNEILPTDLRRLKHQPKSSPFELCIATATTELKSTNNNNNNNNSIKLPQTPTAIPAPIVSTDFVNTPIVKIDYSNLALHDTSYSESPTSSSSSSSPSVDKSVTCIANTQIQKTPPASTSTTASTLATLATAENPVINIDLSNIVTSGTISASSNFAPVAMPTATVIVPPAPATTSKQNSYLELDEDYDNI